MTIQSQIKKLCKGIQDDAADFEESHSHDHATQQAHDAAASAMRLIADRIGEVLIGTENFDDDDQTNGGG